jgi:hypothetical protein
MEIEGMRMTGERAKTRSFGIVVKMKRQKKLFEEMN